MDGGGSSALRSTSRLYQSVVDDVMKNVREAFNDEGIDETVIKELKELWEQKLSVTKVVEQDPSAMKRSLNVVAPNMNSINTIQPTVQRQPVQAPAAMSQHRIRYSNQVVHFPNTNVTAVPSASNFVSNMPIVRLVDGVPVVTNSLSGAAPSTSQATVTLPIPVAGHNLESDNRPVKYLIVPQIQGSNNSNNIIMGNIATASASNVAQNLSYSAVGVHQQVPATGHDARKDQKPKNVVQLDGPGAISDDEDEFDNIDENDEELEEDDENADFVEEGEPLNSEDDDKLNENADELFEADDIVVCQYENVIRTRSKWKFFLKDGIMNLKGKDYVFNKATGESEF